MDTNEPGRDRTADDHDEGEKENLALGPFIRAVGECADLLARLRERVEGHLGVPPGDVDWGRVADADRLLRYLRHAAFAAGIGEEPVP